jgi:predicted nucleic acid-binding protein
MQTKRSSAAGTVAKKSANTASTWGQLKVNDLVLVDSAPLIYLLDGHPQFSSLFEGLFVAFEDGQLRIAISTITIAEVLAGPFKNGQDVLAKRYEKALSGFEVIPVSQDIAVSASRLRISCKLKLMDALQAATALEIGAQALVTHDRDFSRFSGLAVLCGGDDGDK